MTETDERLDANIGNLADMVRDIDISEMADSVLRGWVEMCAGALSALSKRPQMHRVNEWSICDILQHVSAHANTRVRFLLADENTRVDCDIAGEFLSLAYAKLEKLELEKRAKERLETVTVAQQNGVTPIGIAIEGAQKGQLVSVQVGATSSPAVAPPCPPNCKFAKWRTDGKPSTEPGYSARCDVCKPHKNRPCYEPDGELSRGERLVIDIASQYIDPNMNWRTDEPKQSGCRGGCNCQKEPLYK